MQKNYNICRITEKLKTQYVETMDFPYELIEIVIVEWLDFNTIYHFSQVCKYFNRQWKYMVKLIPWEIKYLCDDRKLRNFPSLTKLDIGANEIITDYSIHMLVSLKHLSFGSNQKITNDSVFCLTNLTTLIISQNQKI